MMRRRYFSALMFTAVLVFASPAGKTMASQVSENQTQNTTEDMNAAVSSETEKQVSDADDAITTVEEVFGERPYYGPGETEVMYIILRCFQRMRIRIHICQRKNMWKAMIHTD